MDGNMCGNFMFSRLGINAQPTHSGSKKKDSYISKVQAKPGLTGGLAFAYSYASLRNLQNMEKEMYHG